MALPLHILLPGAIIAVTLLSLFIWWLTGTKTRKVDAAAVADYLARSYPGEAVRDIFIDEADNLALATMADENEIRLVRPLGNRLIDQIFSVDEIQHEGAGKDGDMLRFPRQGIACPAVSFKLETGAWARLDKMRNAKT